MLLVAAASALPESGALAGVVSIWTGAAGELFSEPDNWSPAPPTVADTALFDLAGSHTVVLDEPSDLHQVILRDGQWSFELLNPIEALSTTALVPSWVIGDTAGFSSSLTASDGSLLGQFMDVASAAGGFGSLVVESGASVELGEILSVGPRGTGLVAVDGVLQARRAISGALGAGFGSLVVSGVGASAFIDELLSIGQKGGGGLTVASGASASAGTMIVGFDVGSTGLATITGPDASLSVAGRVDIGRNGIGEVDVLDGASVTFGDDLILGTIAATFPSMPPAPAGEGTLIVEGAGSVVTVAGTCHAPLTGFGTLRVNDGGQLLAASVKVNAALTTLSFRVGASGGPACIQVGGLFSGAGATPCSVTFQRGFVPAYGQEFTLIAAAGMTGSFALNLPAVPPPLTISGGIETTGSGKALIVRIGANADLNGDGVVDSTDLGILISAWGSSGTGDLNGDGVVDGTDLGILLAQWEP
jgi:T5SS/PEP-CTERM-associated repeat protein